MWVKGTCWNRQWQPTPVLLPGGLQSMGSRLSDFPFTFHFHALEKEMATHSSVLAWRIPGMGEPGGLPSLGSHRVGHDWSDLAAAAEIGSLNTCPVLNSFLVTTRGGLPEGSCLLPAPGPWEYKVPIRAVFIVAVTKNSTRGQHFFMFHFNFSFICTLLFTLE